MPERHMTPSAVMLFLMRKTEKGTEILLQKRQNTGYGDGMWDCAASGHVEAGESMKAALIREAGEELNIRLSWEQITFATLTHKYIPKSTGSYYNAYFAASQYEGEPIINEPHKCSALEWFNVNSLPSDILPDRKEALENYFSHIPYDELGWEQCT